MQKFEKDTGIWEMAKACFLPLVLYSMVNSLIVMTGMTYLTDTGIAGKPYDTYVTTAVRMLGMLLGGVFVLPFYRKEKSLKEGEKEGSLRAFDGIRIVLFGVLLSLGTNFFLSMSGWMEQSAGYEQVAEVQFSLPLWLALLYYGILSPVVEEMVFRGIAYGSLQRFLPKTAAVAGSALLFGMFHGNMVQMVYGTFMGIFLALYYDKYHKLSAPVLFHGAANTAVYLWSYFF